MNIRGSGKDILRKAFHWDPVKTQGTGAADHLKQTRHQILASKAVPRPRKPKPLGTAPAAADRIRSPISDQTERRPIVEESRAGHAKQILLSAALILVITLISLWQDRGFYYNDDFQVTFLPAYHECVRLWGQGHVPLLSGNSWLGANLAGEGQYGVFSPFFQAILGIVVHSHLSEPLQAALLVFLLQLVLGLGVYALATSYGLPPAYRHFCVVSTVFAGWNLRWACGSWPHYLSSFCSLPWCWFFMRRLQMAVTPARWLLLVASAYSLLAVFVPHNILILALVVAYHCLESELSTRSRMGLAYTFLGLGVAALLWAPTLLGVIAATHDGDRANMRIGGLWMRSVPLEFWRFLLAPFHWGRHGYLWSIPTSCSAEDMVGLQVPTLALLAGLVSRTSLSRGAALLLLFSACIMGLAMCPGVPPLRFNYRWLILLVLVFPLFAAILHSESDRVARYFPILAGFLVPASVLLDWLLTNPTSPDIPRLTEASLVWAGGVAVLASVSWCMRKRRSGFDCLSIALWTALVLVLLPREPLFPRWPFAVQSNLPEFSAEVRYVGFYDHRVMYGPDGKTCILKGPLRTILYANRSMLANLEFVDGQSPQIYGRFDAVWGKVYETECTPALPDYLSQVFVRFVAPGGFLAALGVDGLVMAGGFSPAYPVLQQAGWTQVACDKDATVWHRNTLRQPKPVAASVTKAALAGRPDAAMQLVRSQQPPFMTVLEAPSTVSLPAPPDEALRLGNVGSLPFTVRENLPTRCILHQDEATTQLSVVVFHRAWWPGYVAHRGGEDLPVFRANAIEIALCIPPGPPGLITLEFRPAWLRRGLWLAALGAALALGIGWHLRRRR